MFGGAEQKLLRLVHAAVAWRPPAISWERVAGADIGAGKSMLVYTKPIYLFEATVRTWLVHTPRVLSKRIPSFNRTISLLFM